MLDVNVLVSSVIAPQGIPRRLVSAWRDGRYALIVSSGTIAQVEDKLKSPRIGRRYGIPSEVVLAAVTVLRSEALFAPVPLQERLSITGDPEDDYVLATARLAKADYLVTGDRGLLALSQHDGVAIVSPRQFSDILGLPAA